ncbi:hypothetical protein [Halococcus hamelinensis]|uniref:Uncharacterized protein n=1 Tax=Halococcus hamelinensis 100A6 TaxID=1132509 RepID=M0M1H7_9EURY|nr:hypothetical protein [Halococcus hamelinensis]EMA38449.1 hypothetical protein C447_09852 [Halococcus hamelinensis 100A6]
MSERELADRVSDLERDVYGYDTTTSPGKAVAANIKRVVVFLDGVVDEDEGEDAPRGVALEDVYAVAEVLNIDRELAEQAHARLRRIGEVYEPADGRTCPT